MVKKYSISFFIGTFLEQLLRTKLVDTVVLAGISTEGGVEWTARHASALGFIPVIAEDAVGSTDPRLHNLALSIMREMYPMLETRAIVKSLGNAKTRRNHS